MAYAYEKFVHGAYITAMELYNGRTYKFMMRGHESEMNRRENKGAVAGKLHEVVTALGLMAWVANMPALGSSYWSGYAGTIRLARAVARLTSFSGEAPQPRRP
jgi:hypothetical protein